jgi:vancomycin resistance protein VanJ
MGTNDSGRRHRQFVGVDGRVHDTTVEKRRESSYTPPPRPVAPKPPKKPRVSLLKRLDRAAAWWLAPLAAQRWYVRAAAWIAWGSLVAIVTTWLLMIWKSESWVAPTLLLYGPRIWLGAPLAAIAVVVTVIRARLALPVAIAGMVLLGPIAGWRTGWRGWASVDAPVVRVMTLNAANRELSIGPAALVAQTGIDVWLLQECGDRTWEQLRAALQSWYGRRDYGLCTLSRWPQVAVDTMPREDFERARIERGTAAAAYVVRTTVDAPIGPISVVNLHLATARWGLGGFLPSVVRGGGSISAAGEQFSGNAQLRRFESERAARWASKQPSPLVVGGDFNQPVESALYRQYWAPKFTDAWESVGRGFGYTKFERWIRIRIDHLLSDDGLKPLTAEVGPDVGSDHRPVIVSYARR